MTDKTQRYFAYVDNRLIEVGGDYAGAESTITVTNLDHGLLRLEIDQYYCSSGILRLEITQPLPRALRMFEALLERDAF